MNVQRFWVALSSTLMAAAIVACGDSETTPGGGAGGSGGGGSDAVGGAGGAPCIEIPASEETVTTDNEYGTLEGTLLLPATCGPAPVVLILSGSGSSDRDGDAPQMYRMLAESLLEGGIGSLRYDDHGIGGSVTAAPDKVQDFRFDLEIADAARWVEVLREDERVGNVVFAGHSQGSLTAILASRTAPVDGFVSLAGAGRPAGQLLHEQLADDLTPEQLAELDAAIEKLESGELAGSLTPPLDQILPVSVQPYLISWLKYDPKVEIASMTAPTLLVQGEVDIQVSVLDAELLHEGLPSAELLLIGDMCHVLKQATASPFSQQKAYQDPSVPLAPELVPAVSAFVLDLP